MWLNALAKFYGMVCSVSPFGQTKLAKFRLASEDQRHEVTYPIESSYLVFPESYRSFLMGAYIGTIVLSNRGTTPILLVSHVRKAQPDRMTYYKLHVRNMRLCY